MKLAEALQIRSDMQKQLASLHTRIASNIVIQQDEEPAEHPNDLLIEAQQLNNELHAIILRIHQTNATVQLPNGQTMLEALVERDLLIQRHRIVMTALNQARQKTDRYSGREIKWVTVVNVSGLQKQADDIAQKIRQVNLLLQEANWHIDLL